MYQILCDGHILYDLRDESYLLYSPTLHLNANSAGVLSFTIYGNHPNFQALKKLRSEISVLRDGKIIWKGRIISSRKGFYTDWQVKCEGKLAFFNDSVLREFDFNGTPEGFFRTVVDNHNSQVSDFQKFKIGEVTVTDPNDYIVRSSESALSTFDVLGTRVFGSSLGGYLNIRYEDDGDYIDWLADFTAVSKQEIRFGENLLGLTQETDTEETCTAILPQGAVGEDGKRIGIASVNNGLDYIINTEMAAQYGVIFAPREASIWDDVTEPENLLKKAEEYLGKTGIKLKETIELRALDLNLTNAEIGGFNHCEYIRVVSEPHGIDSLYLLREMDIPLDEPQNMVITIGESRRSLADLTFGGGSNNEDFLLKVDKLEKQIPKDVGELENGPGFQTADDVVQLIEKTVTVEVEAVSPVVAVKTATADEYVLTVTDVKGAYDTPNLKGEKGDQGPQGLKGATGAKGDKGDKGEKGDQGLQGIQGERGPQGIQGPQGLQGPKGDTGEKGEKGDKGDQGAKGEQGARGLQGIQGAKGDTGEKGEQGLQGPKGATGEKGDKGDMGEKGEKGDQGPQGIQGERGPQGERGDSGITVPVSGLFTLSVDTAGDMWAYYADGSTPPDFEMDADCNLYYIIPD